MLSSQLTGATVQQLLVNYHNSPTFNSHVESVLTHIKTCRTAALGYHLYQCTNEACGFLKYQYHSCRDRHCPHCGALKKQQWVDARMQELLPVRYYHMVFTLPHELNSIILGNRRLLFKLLFDAAASTLLSFAKDPQFLNATPGIISILHTWGQQLAFHPHVHCIVSGGGVTKDSRWREGVKCKYGFLFPVKAMSVLYRGKFLAGLRELFNQKEMQIKQGTNLLQFINTLYNKDWVVYAKAPFAGPEAVIKYLGQYTHKVAISNHRICSIDEVQQTVTFEYKDYADHNRIKRMTLSCQEFIRRFAQHILPERFTKIRTYGYLCNRHRKHRVRQMLQHLKLPQHKGEVRLPLDVSMLAYYGIDVTLCPCCKCQSLKLIAVQYSFAIGHDG